MQIGLRDREPLHDANEPRESERIGRTLTGHARHARVPKGRQEHLRKYQKVAESTRRVVHDESEVDKEVLGQFQRMLCLYLGSLYY